MSEPDGAVRDLDHLRLEAGLEHVVADARRTEHLERRLPFRGRECEGVPGRLWQAGEPRSDEPLERLWDGQRLRRVDVGSQRPRELERVERVAARGLMARQPSPGISLSRAGL